MTSPPPTVTTATAPRRALVRRLLSVLLAGIAIAFVALVVPVRDRCIDPASGQKLVRVLETAGGPGACRLERKNAPPIVLGPEACRELSCEPGLATVFGAARPSWLAMMLGLYFVGTFAWAVRWRELLALANLRLRSLYVWRVTLEAQAGGILLPGGVAGDALRIGAMVGQGVPLSTVVASVLLDRVVGLVTLASVAGLLALAGGSLGTAVGQGVAITLAAFPVGLAVGLAIIRSAPVARFLTEGKLAKIAREPVLYLTSPHALRAIARATVASAVVSLTQLFVVRGLVTALGGAPTEPRWIYLGAAMAFMVAAVPVLPGGWGTSDAAFVFFFRFAGLPAPVALGVCLLYRAFWYLSGLVGALLRTTRQHDS